MVSSGFSGILAYSRTYLRFPSRVKKADSAASNYSTYPPDWEAPQDHIFVASAVLGHKFDFTHVEKIQIVKLRRLSVPFLSCCARCKECVMNMLINLAHSRNQRQGISLWTTSLSTVI